MNAIELAALKDAFKDIWNKLPSEERAILEQRAKEAHQHLLAIRAGEKSTPPDTALPPELGLIYSLLNDDLDDLLKDAIDPSSILTIVGGAGEIFFGGIKYDQTDIGWLYTFLAWHETEGKEPPFNNSPNIIQIPNDATIAILGDWGGNNEAAQAVAKTAGTLNPDYFIHLGDVYYAGTDKSDLIERDYQKEHFLDVWPGKAGKSFNLNSNHDMYAHGTGYFNVALTSSLFSAQNGCSYFALYNDAFRIVGLDTAYYDPDQIWYGFMKGDLGPTGKGTQAQFLHDQAQAAADADQQLIILSHHPGLSIDGLKTLTLWDQVTAQLSPLNGKEVLWYWGHEHLGAVYDEQTSSSGIKIHSRCCGHGCIPWGIATDLDSPKVQWHEQELLGPGSNYMVTNGFATLTLTSSTPKLQEAFYGQTDGSPHWSHPEK